MNKIGENTVGKQTLDELVNIVPGIYSNQDAYRSVWDVWLHATHHAAAIGEEVRKYKPGQTLLKEIADFSMWLFTLEHIIKGPFETLKGTNRRIGELTIRTEKEFSDIIWNKYPGVCPVCFWRRTKNSSKEIEKPCDCMIFDIENRNIAGNDGDKGKKEEDKKNRVRALRNYADTRSKADKKPKTIDEWQDMFRKIYEANLRHTSLVDIGFHLLEEVGEVSDAIVRMYSYKDTFNGQPRWNQVWLEEEIADVFSWLMTLVNSLQLIPDITQEFLEYLEVYNFVKLSTKIQLSQIIWHRYGSKERGVFRCPACGEPQCKCKLLWVGENVEYDEFLKIVNNSTLT